MTEPVNLNKVRKQRARADKRAHADENAVRFGRTKSQKKAQADEASIASRALDGHKRDT